MSDVSWTLEYDNGVSTEEKSLEAWGIKAPTISLLSQDIDRLTFTVSVEDMFEDPPFDFETTVTLKRDGVTWFVGVVQQPDAIGTDQEEILRYEALGPWYWLEHRQHKQGWKTWDPDVEAIVTKEKSHVFLGLDIDGNQITVSAVIQEVLDRLISLGVPIAYDSGDFPTVQTPVMEFNEVTAADAIRNILKFTPDAVLWWDYSTTPNPTLHIARRADLDAVSLPVTSSPQQLEDIQIRSRKDLQRTEVVINYGKLNSVNGTTFNTVETDKYPPAATGNAHRGVNLNIELAGSSVTFVSAKVETSVINADHATEAIRKAWWQARIPWLQASEIDSFNVATVVRSSALPREALASGAPIAAWMQDGVGSDIQAELETITAVVTFTKTDGTSGTREISHQLTATDATSKTYSTLAESTPEEPTPVGLAEAFYDAVNELHFDGEFTFLEDEVTGLAGVGKVLNLTGGRAEWTTMRAMIFQVDYDLEAGQTKLHIGPQPHLGIPDLVQLLRATHTRLTWTNHRARSTGISGTVSEVQLPATQPTENDIAGVDKFKRMKVVGEDGGIIDLDAAEAFYNSVAHHLKPRVLDLCLEQADGSHYKAKIIVLCSEPFNIVAT